MDQEDQFEDEGYVTPIQIQEDDSFGFVRDLDRANAFIHVSKWTRDGSFLGQLHEGGKAGNFIEVTPEMIDCVKVTWLVMGDAQMTIDCVMQDRS